MLKMSAKHDHIQTAWDGTLLCKRLGSKITWWEVNRCSPSISLHIQTMLLMHVIDKNICKESSSVNSLNSSTWEKLIHFFLLFDNSYVYMKSVETVLFSFKTTATKQESWPYYTAEYSTFGWGWYRPLCRASGQLVRNPSCHHSTGS